MSSLDTNSLSAKLFSDCRAVFIDGRNGRATWLRAHRIGVRGHRDITGFRPDSPTAQLRMFRQALYVIDRAIGDPRLTQLSASSV